MFKLVVKKQPKIVKKSKYPIIRIDPTGKIFFNSFAIDILEIKPGDYIMFFYSESEKQFGIGKSTIIKKKLNGKVVMTIDSTTNEEIPKKFGAKLYSSKPLDQFVFKAQELRCSNKFITDKLLSGITNENFYYRIDNNPKDTVIETAFENISVVVFPISFYGSRKLKKHKEKTYKDFE